MILESLDFSTCSDMQLVDNRCLYDHICDFLRDPQGISELPLESRTCEVFRYFQDDPFGATRFNTCSQELPPTCFQTSYT